MSLRADVITAPAKLEALASSWEALLAESEVDGPMASPLWLLTWWRVFGEADGRRLAVIAVRDGDRLAGLAPLCARTSWYARGIPFRRLELLGTGEREEDEICSEYLGVVAARGAEGTVARAVAEALASGACGPWDELVLDAMDRAGAMPACLVEELTRLGAATEIVPAGAAPVIDLPESFPVYLSRLSASGRYLVTRSLRDFDRWAEGQAELRVASTPAEMEEGRRALLALHGERWSDGGAFASARFRAFHDAVMPRLLDRGALELMWLSVRGEPVAAVYNMVWRDRVYFYQSGRRLDVPRGARPGVVLHARAVERAIAAGRRAYDFLGGAARYKVELCTGARTLVRLRAAREPAGVRERARHLAQEGAATMRVVSRALGRRPSVGARDPLPTAVLAGDLNMLRCFKGSGVPTVMLATDPDAPSLFSRHAGQRRVIADPSAQPAQALADLLDLGRLLPGKPALFYGDDAMLLLVSRHRTELEAAYRFRLPSPDRIESLVDKIRFAVLARELDLPVPRTVTSAEHRDAATIAQLLPAPFIVKPSSHLGFRTSPAVTSLGVGPLKALRADDEEGLARTIARMESFSTDFVVQEHIPGGEQHVHTFHAYLDAGGRALGCYVGRKIRTYPRAAGVSTFLELCDEPELTRAALEVIAKLDLVGVVKLDYKRDPRDGRFYLLEVNPRFSLWNHLGAASGVNLPLIAHLDLAGRSPAPAPPARTGVRWLSLADDARAFVRDYAPAGELTLGGWLASLQGPKVFDVFAWDDPSPFAVNALRALAARSRMVRRGGARHA